MRPAPLLDEELVLEAAAALDIKPQHVLVEHHDLHALRGPVFSLPDACMATQRDSEREREKGRKQGSSKS